MDNTTINQPVTYSLSIKGDEKSFYKELEIFTQSVIQELSIFFNKEVDGLVKFLSQNKTEELRTKEEYSFELIIIGTLWNIYNGYAQKDNSFVVDTLLPHLNNLRKKNQMLKPYVDDVKGYFLTRIYSNPEVDVKPEYSLYEFKRLIKWLDATGEFGEEVKRMNNWYAFLLGFSDERVKQLLSKVSSYATYFSDLSRNALGQYTNGVHNYLKNIHPQMKNREDYIFCGRKEEEYLMNLVGAEVLNKSLKKSFSQASKRVILLPTCMCKPDNGQCKAIFAEIEGKCTSCSRNCIVNTIKNQVEDKNTTVALITHSSSFSRVLQKYENQTGVGLVGIACILNLLTGGYELKRLNIPAQCVFLNYSGCKKHWTKDGVPTTLYIEQLKQILAQKEIATTHEAKEEVKMAV
ncbi:MAG TPA: DUF116 domain-containing protein [Bacteroidales bacterium]